MNEDNIFGERLWEISLWAKVNRIYSKVGVFWEETTDPEEAYEVFKDSFDYLPPKAAIDFVNSATTEQVITTIEVRLYDGNLLVASAGWDKKIIDACIKDSMENPEQKRIVKIEVTLPFDFDSDGADLEEILSIASDAELLDITTVDSI
jgi:hypothetical protein